MNFDDMPWLVTMTINGKTRTFGPSTPSGATELRDALRVAAPGLTIQAWAAQAPNLATIEPTEAAWTAVAS